jgi:hypothetical protein
MIMIKYDDLLPVLDRYLAEEVVVIPKRSFRALELEIERVDGWLKRCLETYQWDLDQRGACVEDLITMRCAVQRYKSLLKIED